MGVFSNNRTTIGCDIDIPVAEGYRTSVAADVMLVEAVQTDMSLFEAILYNDFVEVAALKEGTVLESEMQAITENAFHSMVAKVKETLKKIIAKIKALFATFMAKFNNVVIKDNKKFAESIKKQLFGTDKDYSKMEYTWREKKESTYETLGTKSHDMLNSDEDINAKTSETEVKAELQKYENANVTEIMLGKIFGEDSMSMSDFAERFEKECFGEEKTIKGSKKAIQASYDFLTSSDLKTIKTLKKENKEWETKFNNKLKHWESEERKLKDKSSDEKASAEEKLAYVKASCLSKMYNGMYSAVVATHKAMVSVAKLEIKQHRQLLVKAVAFNPVKEDAILMMEAAESEDYEVDALLDGFDDDEE